MWLFLDLNRIILYHIDKNTKSNKIYAFVVINNTKCIKHYIKVSQTWICEATAWGLYI